MALTIPDYANAPGGFIEASGPDSVDFDAIVAGFNVTGVVSGLAVTQRGAGANLSVDVSAGSAYVAGTLSSLGSTSNQAITADATNPRWALVSFGSGTATVTLGTAAASPVFPAIPAGKTLLAAVWVPAAAGSILNANVVDKRVILGAFPAATVVSQTAFGAAAAVGNGPGWANENHAHGTPPTPVTSAVAGTGIGVSGSTGAVTISNTGALSVAGRTGAVALTAADVGAGTFPGANSFTGLQTFNAGLTVPSGQALTTGTRSVVTGTRATTTNASDTVDLGTFSSTGGAIELRITAHLAAPASGATASKTKVYEFSVDSTTGLIGNGTFTDAGSLGGGYKVLPCDQDAAQATSNDFALEVRRSAAGTFIFRFRQISIGVAGAITFTVESLGDTAVTFTPSSTVTAAPSAVTTLHPSNNLDAVAGNIGIGTDAPATPLHMLGSGDQLLRVQSSSTNATAGLDLRNASAGPGYVAMAWTSGIGFSDMFTGDIIVAAPSGKTVRIGAMTGANASSLQVSATDVTFTDSTTVARSMPRGNKYTPSKQTANTTLSTTLNTFTTVYTAPSATYLANRPYLLIFAGGYVQASANGGTNTYDMRILSGATVLAVGTTGTSVANDRNQLSAIGFWVPGVDTTVALTVAVAQTGGTVTAASAYNIGGSGYGALQVIDIGTQ